MKLRKTLLLLSAGLLTGAAMTACGENDKVLRIVMVASNDADTVETRAKQLIPTLEAAAPGYKFDITVSPSYDAAAEALVAKQAEAAFLPAGTYAQYTVTNKGTMDVLCTSTRAGYKVQADDFPGFDETAREAQRNAMNGKDGYVYKGQQSEQVVSYYSSILFTRRDAYSHTKGYKEFDVNKDGEITLQELHDAEAVFGVMGTTSSAGYIYPTYWAYQKGFTKGFVSVDEYKALSEADKAKALIGVNQGSYPNGVDALMSGTIDVSCGFMDTRYGSAWVQEGGKYYHDDTLFTNTYTVGVTDPIMNDTITVSTKNKKAANKAIFDAFVAAAATGSSSDTTTPAGILYQIYSHTGYLEAKDSDFDSARAMYAWTKATQSK